MIRVIVMKSKNYGTFKREERIFHSKLSDVSIVHCTEMQAAVRLRCDTNIYSSL